MEIMSFLLIAVSVLKKDNSASCWPFLPPRPPHILTGGKCFGTPWGGVIVMVNGGSSFSLSLATISTNSLADFAESGLSWPRQRRTHSKEIKTSTYRPLLGTYCDPVWRKALRPYLQDI